MSTEAAYEAAYTLWSSLHGNDAHEDEVDDWTFTTSSRSNPLLEKVTIICDVCGQAVSVEITLPRAGR